MTIQRYRITGMYHSEVYIDEDESGEWIGFSDYLKAVESLEYDIRWYQEQLQDCEAALDIVKDERNYYEEKYNELYEQTS